MAASRLADVTRSRCICCPLKLRRKRRFAGGSGGAGGGCSSGAGEIWSKDSGGTGGGSICTTFMVVKASFNRVCLLLNDRRFLIRSCSKSRAIEFNSISNLSEEPDGSLLLVSILSVQQSTKL